MKKLRCSKCGKKAGEVDWFVDVGFHDGDTEIICADCWRKNYNDQSASGKLRWLLLPWREVEQVVKLLTDGTADHADEGWKTEDQTSHFEALMRHLTAWRKGEKRDAGTGASPLVLVAVRALFLLWHENERKL